MSRKDKRTIPCVCFLVFACLLANLTLAVPPVSATTYDFDDGIRELVSGLLSKKGNLLRNKKIAVFGIVEQTGKEQWLITASIEDGILDALLDEGYTVLERSRIDDVLKKELKKSADQWFDESQVADVGKFLGADAVITGDYTLWGNQALRVTVRCINVSDGRLLAANKVMLHTDRIQHLLKKAEPMKQGMQKDAPGKKVQMETPRSEPPRAVAEPIRDRAEKTVLKVSADVAGAQVWVDGKEHKTAPVTLTDLPPGPHTVRVVKEGYEPTEEKVLLMRGTALTVDVFLKRIVTSGAIHVTGTPQGAKIYFKGYYVGTVPMELKDLEPGTYEVRVIQDGYEPWEKRLEVKKGETVKAEATLLTPGAKKGRLYVDAEPSGATVKVLNIGPRFHQGMELESGRYHVEVSASGHAAWREWVSLGTGEDKRLTVRLNPVSAPPREEKAKTSTAGSDAIKRDGIYVAYANGVVRDTSTGLEWKAGPDKDTTWDAARSWVERLGGDWRMPTMDELEGLYKKGKSNRNMTPFLKTTGCFVWSAEPEEGFSGARVFVFSKGRRDWLFHNISSSVRAFAVRSRSDGTGQEDAAHVQPTPVSSPSHEDAVKTSTAGSDVLKRDGVYVAYANGVVRDTSTGLEWKVGPDKNTNWDEARSWVQDLGGDWRMPTMDELAGLYKRGMGPHNVTSLLNATSGKYLWVWSSETKGSSDALAFGFDAGNRGVGTRDASGYIGRAFAVRSRSDGTGEEKRAAVRPNPVSAPPRAEKAKTSTAGSDEIGRDGVYVAYANGIVRDTSTGLEWKVGPDKNTNWDEAQSWVQSLGGDWRMPTMEELAGLYKKGTGPYNITYLLKPTSEKYLWVWSGEAKDSSLVYDFNFNIGRTNYIGRYVSSFKRALAVRSRSDG